MCKSYAQYSSSLIKHKAPLAAGTSTSVLLSPIPPDVLQPAHSVGLGRAMASWLLPEDDVSADPEHHAEPEHNRIKARLRTLLPKIHVQMKELLTITRQMVSRAVPPRRIFGAVRNPIRLRSIGCLIRPSQYLGQASRRRPLSRCNGAYSTLGANQDRLLYYLLNQFLNATRGARRNLILNAQMLNCQCPHLRIPGLPPPRRSVAVPLYPRPSLSLNSVQMDSMPRICWWMEPPPFFKPFNRQPSIRTKHGIVEGALLDWMFLWLPLLKTAR